MIGFSAESTGLGVAAVLLLALLTVLWFVLASAAALKGDSAEPNRMAQMYGYTVCVIAVIVGLTSFSSILGAAFDRAHPLQTEYVYGASLVSFEAYRATVGRERAMMGPNAPPQDTATDVTLRARYDALVADRMSSTLYRTSKTFVTNGVLFVVAALLFLVHWRWVKRLSVTRAAG